jgi:hypothetical protein
MPGPSEASGAFGADILRVLRGSIDRCIIYTQ